MWLSQAIFGISIFIFSGFGKGLFMPSCCTGLVVQLYRSRLMCLTLRGEPVWGVCVSTFPGPVDGFTSGLCSAGFPLCLSLLGSAVLWLVSSWDLKLFPTSNFPRALTLKAEVLSGPNRKPLRCVCVLLAVCFSKPVMCTCAGLYNA